jgi:hypothetical protein
VRRGQENDPLYVGGQPVDDGRRRLRRSGPDKEDRTDSMQRGVERFGHGEIAADDLDVRRQRRRRLGAVHQGADRHARVGQQVDHGATDPSGRPGDEHRRSSCRCHESPALVDGVQQASVSSMVLIKM